MPQREFLGIHAREMELTAELSALEAHRRYALAHEERRHFYTAYRSLSYEQHSQFSEIFTHHFAKARRAEAESHSITTKLQILRSRFLLQLSLGNDIESESSAAMRLHAPFIRSISPSIRGQIRGSPTAMTGTSEQSLDLQDRASASVRSCGDAPTVAPTQDQRDGAAQYWYTRAIGLDVDEKSALLSMQQYLSGERDDEVADLLRQRTVEQERDTAIDQQRRDDQAYRVLVEDTLRQEAEQRRAGVASNNFEGTTHESDSCLIRNLAWEVEKLKLRITMLSSKDRATACEADLSGDHSSIGSSEIVAHSAVQPPYTPAEGEAGPSTWFYTETEEHGEFGWSHAGSSDATGSSPTHVDAVTSLKSTSSGINP